MGRISNKNPRRVKFISQPAGESVSIQDPISEGILIVDPVGADTITDPDGAPELIGAQRIRRAKALPIRIVAAPTSANAFLGNSAPMQVIEDTVGDRVLDNEPMNVYVDNSAFAANLIPNAEPVLVYIVSGSPETLGEILEPITGDDIQEPTSLDNILEP